MNTHRNWSDLELDLLELILKRLALADVVRCKLVSSLWNTVVESYISSPVTYKPLLPQSPWLLVSPKPGEDEKDALFYSLSEEKVYKFRNLFEGIDSNQPLGSSYGWLVISDFESLAIYLFNPISRVRILLPPLVGVHPNEIYNVFLSSDPSCSTTFYVVVNYSKNYDIKGTSFHKHKHGEHDGYNAAATCWTELDREFGRVFFYNNFLCGMSLRSKSIRVYDLGDTTSTIKTIDFQPPKWDATRKHDIPNLVMAASQGEILVVVEYIDTRGKLHYEVCKLNFSAANNKVDCVKMECLQDRCLVSTEFGRSTIVLPTLDFPKLEPNTVYVAEERYALERRGDIRYLEVNAHNLENQGFKSIFTFG